MKLQIQPDLFCAWLLMGSAISGLTVAAFGQSTSYHSPPISKTWHSSSNSGALTTKNVSTVLDDGRIKVLTASGGIYLQQVHKTGPTGGNGAAQRPYPACIVCHDNIENATENMGFNLDCTYCHGGDPQSTEKETAHVLPTLPVIMDETVPPLDYDLAYQKFINPSNLRAVGETCGTCHEEKIQDVKKGLMATTAGHYAGGLYQNNVVNTKMPIFGTFEVFDDDGEVPSDTGAVEGLLDLIRYNPNDDPTEFSTHYAAVPAQICARCHLWSRGKGYRGATGAEGTYRADGCAACHLPYANDGLSLSGDQNIDHQETGHPRYHRVTKAVPTEQCVRCHHRGARIGLSYTGRAQMPPRLPSGEGVSGTTNERFNGNYHFSSETMNPPDIHHELGLHCIDCHTRAGIMGDGNIYGHMDQATKIECRTCHGLPNEAPTLLDHDGNRLWNLHFETGRNAQDKLLILTSKVTGKNHVVPQVENIATPQSQEYNAKAAAAMNAKHLKEAGGLECYACHSAWIPNCYGCHFERDEREMGLNLLTRKLEIGKTRTDNKVFESMRNFSFGPNSDGRIAPYMVACQPIADVTGPDSSKIMDFTMPSTCNGLSGLAMNPVNPHTTRGRGEVRTCAECHRAPPSLGFGTGNYSVARNYAFSATKDGVRVYDRKTDPQHPVLMGTIPVPKALALVSKPNVVEGTTDFLYVAAGHDGLFTFDLRSGIPTEPLSRIECINAIQVNRAAGYLFVVVDGVGVNIYDTHDPFNTELISNIPIPSANCAVPWGVHLFVAAGSDGVVVVELLDHADPEIVGSLTEINAHDIRLYAHYQAGNNFAARAYVVDPGYGIHVIDLVSGFSTPQRIGGLELPGATALDIYTRYQRANGITPAEEHDYLYVAAGMAGLHVFDITRPDDIVRVSHLSTPGADTIGVDVVSQLAPPGVDDYAVLANRDLGLQIINVNDPLNPVLTGSVAAPVTGPVFVEVQQMDRFIDEECMPLKENSHPFTGVLSHEEVVRILSVADIDP